MGTSQVLDTIWEVSDHLWEQLRPALLEMDPPKITGRKRVDPRQMLNGIIFRMRSGCQWNHLPKELGDDSSRACNRSQSSRPGNADALLRDPVNARVPESEQ